MSLLIGADLGGTKLSAVVLDEAGQVVHRAWLTHAAADYPAVLRAIEIVTQQCVEYAQRRGEQILGLGLAVAGWLSRDRSELLWGANIGSRGTRLKADLQDRLRMPVAIDNDGNATALAEQRLGAGREARMLVLLTLGTGLGGGVILDGHPLVGGSGMAAELGHISVTEQGPRCVCGGWGCAELFASGQGLVRQYLAEQDQQGTSPPPWPPPTSVGIVAAAAAGEPIAAAVLRTAGLALARILRLVIPALDPDLVLIGGSVGHAAGSLLLPVITAELGRQRPMAAVTAAVPVALAALGPEAGALGAAELIQDLLSLPVRPRLSPLTLIQGEPTS